MKNKTANKIAKVTISYAIIITVLCSCCSNLISTPNDDKYLSEFHKTYFEVQDGLLLPDRLSLYVDYSTCMIMGQNSAFFTDLVPSFAKATKEYYSVKGNEIQKEEGSDTYSLLKSIKEVPYANLLDAANRIVDGNTEGALLTDGEFYQPSIAKSHVNDPYLTDAFKKWILKGHDIHIMAEPYVEIFHGKSFNKKRFYILFTDDRLASNIYQRIVETVDLTKYPEIDQYHLSASHPKLNGKSNFSTPNTNLACTPKGFGTHEVQDWTIDWESIEELIASTTDDEGNPIENGGTLIGGLGVDRNSFGSFRIQSVNLKIYNINTEYYDFYSKKDAGEKIGKNKMELVEAANFLTLDNKEFDSHSLINIHFNTNIYDTSLLNGCPYNYFKIDICINKVDNIFNNSAKIFKFDSIDIPGQSNTSLVESIKQCLIEPKIHTMLNGQVLYSIYIKSNKY